MEGVKEKLLDLTQHFNTDREIIKKSIKSCQDLEKQLKDIVSKNKDMMTFRDNFLSFEKRINESIADLTKKYASMFSSSTSKFSNFDDFKQKVEKRLLGLERQTVTHSHKI